MAATTGIFLNLGGGEKACECHGMVMCLEDYFAPSCHQLCCSKEEERILIITRICVGPRLNVHTKVWKKDIPVDNAC